MKPRERLEWIKGWLASHPDEIEISVLHSAFVNDYIEAVQPRWQRMPYDSHRVPILSQDLSALAKGGFERKRIGLNAYEGGKGWPKWVYSYPNPYWKGLTGR